MKKPFRPPSSWDELRQMPLSIAVDEAPNWLTAVRLIFADCDFGFNRGDVENLRHIGNSPACGPFRGGALLDLADRIEALLPPEAK